MRSTILVASAAPAPRDVLLGRRQRLADLAVVAVDGHGLQAELPRQHVQRLDVFDGGVFGHVGRLADRAAEERLHRTHHADVTLVVDDVVAHRAGEHRQVGRVQVGGAEDRLLGVDVGEDVGDLLGRVAQPPQRPRHRLVDERHRAAAHELLQLDQPEVGLDAGGVAVHHQPDGAGGGEHAGLAVAHAELLAAGHGVVPRLTGGVEQRCRHPLLVDVGGGVAVHAQHAQHVLLVVGEAGEGAHAAGDAGRRGVGVAGHQRRDGGGPGPALLAVVGQAERHEHGAEVGVAQAELAEGPGGLGDLLGGVVGVADQDLLGGEDDLDGVAEALDVEGVVVGAGTT